MEAALVSHVEGCVIRLDAGTAEISDFDYLDWRFIEIWRATEAEHQRMQVIRTRILLEALTKQA